MTALNTTSFGYALKNLWPQKRIREVTYKDQPFFALVRKDENFTGDQINLAVKYGDSSGRSATFSNAQTNKAAHLGKKFALTRASDYSLASISNEVIEASKSNDGALLRALDVEMDAAIHTLKRSLGIAMYKSGSGSIGQSSANPSDTNGTITLVNTDDITNFEVGMVIVASSADGGGSLRSGSATVATVNRDTGVLTFTGTITGITTSDYIFADGDYDAKIKGLAAWLPTSAPSATTFFGVDRSVDTVRLGGVRYDGSSLSVEEALVNASVRLGREGGTPDYAFMNFKQFGNLENALGSKVQYVDVEVAGIGFTGMKIHGPKGQITVIPDVNCPLASCYLLQMDTWCLYSLGAAPHVLDGDGMKMLRESSADAYEVRNGYYAQLGCEAPGYNAVVTLAT